MNLTLLEIKLLLVHALLHEIRHAYQAFHMKERYQEEHKTYSLDAEEYGEQFLEKDADEFSYNKLTNQILEIKRIIGA